jgi:hypothetical protein
MIVPEFTNYLVVFMQGFTAPPPHFTKKMLLNNISSVITMVMFTDIYVFHFSIIVSVDP